MKNIRRYMLGAVFGMIVEYIYIVDASVWLIICLAYVGLMIILDLLPKRL